MIREEKTIEKLKVKKEKACADIAFKHGQLCEKLERDENAYKRFKRPAYQIGGKEECRNSNISVTTKL